MFKKELIKKLIIVLLCAAVCGAAFACDKTGKKSEVTLEGISVLQAPDKTEYFEGETFEREGMIVEAKYSDGRSVKISNYSVDKTVLSPEDDAVTVTYRDKSATVAVTVRRFELVGVRIAEQPTKTSYLEGETFDKTGLKVVAIFSNGAEEKIDDYVVDTVTPLTVNDVKRTISYMGKEATVDITVRILDFIALELVGEPIKKVYVEGESFDATGLYIKVIRNGEITYTSNVDFDEAPLKAGDESVGITYLNAGLEVPVTVLGGEAMTFTSSYSEEEYDEMIENYKNAVGVTLLKNDFHDKFDVRNRLPEPHPEGAGSVEEFIEEVDRYVFYGIKSFVVKTEFDYGDIETLLDRVYLESDLLASTASVKGKAVAGGYVQVVVKYYEKDLMIAPVSSAAPVILGGEKRTSSRLKTHVFGAIDEDTGISVYSSDQAIYALTHGFKIAPVENSPAEKIVEKAKEILVAVCDDDMSEFEKMYALQRYVLSRSVYDDSGEEPLGDYCLDKKYESDMVCSLLISFYAEGPLLYGRSVCYGYAKAFGLLLALEGIDVSRVVSQHKDNTGRSSFNYNKSTGRFEAYYIHSYNYVKIDGFDYLCDLTYSYLGSPTLGTQTLTIYRDLCVALTKEEHANIYWNIKSDKIASSGTYNPASFYYQSLSYDGTHSMLCANGEEASAYISLMLSRAKADATNKYFYLPVFIARDGFDGNFTSFIETELADSSIRRYYKYLSTINIGDAAYYFATIVFEKR